MSHNDPGEQRMIELLKISDVQKIYPKSKSQIHKEVAEGKFPRPVKIGERASAWIKEEVLSVAKIKVAVSRACAEEVETCLAAIIMFKHHDNCEADKWIEYFTTVVQDFKKAA
jgi:prophage regulatory protein